MSVINKIFRNNVTWSGGDLSLNSNIQEVYVTSDVSSGKIILPPITGTSNPFDIGGSIKFIDTGGYFKLGVNFEVTEGDLINNISVNNVDSYTLKTDASKFDVVFIPTGTYSNGDLVEWEGDWFVESFLISSTNSITEENISDSSITESKISNSSVSTLKLKDSSVTTDKIANGNVTNDKLDSMTAGTIKGRITTDGSPQDLTVSQVKTLLGAGDANGLATLDENRLVPSSQLPSYVDDVVEVNELPVSGETSKIYVVIPTGDIYRWSGTQFVQINDAVSSADQAAKLATTRSISSTGDATWTVNFDGSDNVSGELSITDGVISNTKLSNMTANTIKGRSDSDGNPQDLTAAQVRALINVEDGAQVNVGTDLSVTNGTTSGPVVNSSTGNNVTLPSASPTTSGVITTGSQTIAGVKTFSSTIGGSITGNSATATKLATARNINGVSFDGTSDITITANTTNSLIAGDGLSGSNFNGSSSITFDVDSTVVRTTGDQNIQGLKTFEDKLTIQGSSQSEVLFNILGTQGELFSITDDLEGLLFSVNDISGIPIFEVYSDNTVKIGEFGSEAIIVEGSEVKLNNATTDDSVTTALFLNDSNQIVKRTISDGAFSSPNDGTLTLSTSGIATGSATTFTANQLSDSTFTVSVPGTNIAQGTRTSTTVPITSSTGTNATLSAASTTLAGVMSAEDKSKLDSIEDSANNYTHPSFVDLSLDIDTGTLSGSVVISDLDFNIESTGGHVTGVNATYSTRELTPGDIGAEPEFTKNEAFNRNFGTTANTVAQGNDYRIINGQTAYDWGNHASEGYLKDISIDILNGDNASQFILNNGSNLKFISEGSTSIGFNDADNSITISSNDTTYSAGTGLLLTGTTFTNDDKGSSQNIFKNIAVSGQTTVVADSNDDTLTLVAGNNISITTNGDTDSITINSSFTDTTYTGSTSVILNGSSFERAALSGDVSASQNSNTLTIGNNKVTTAKIADGNVTNAKLDTMAAETIKGRVSTSGAPQDLTAAQVRTLLGAGDANGLATLDENRLVPSSQLPSYVDDILEYPNFGAFPETGESGKIYVDLDTNNIYRWSGSTYIQVNDAVSTADTATKLANSRTISASGDATWSVTFDGSSNVSSTLTIGNDKVTNAKLDNMSANTIKGRIDSDGDPQDLTPEQVRTLINVEEGAQVNIGTNISQGTRTSTTVPITSSTGTNATLSAASTTLAGVMTAEDKTKLDGIATNANNYTHPTHPGDDINIDTGTLTGAVVISDLDFNVTTDNLGHVTDANATYSTRELTPGDIGAEPAIGTKNTAFNRNFGTTTNTVAQGNDSRIINGQTAYDWGNHASEGYLKDISIPILDGEGTEQFILSNTENLKFIGDGSTTISFNPVDNSVTISSTDTNTDTNNYVSSVGFSTSTGVLTLNRAELSALTVDLDGRYELAGTNDNYSGWNLQTDSIDRGSIGSSEIVNFVGGENVNLNYSATNNTITINSTDTNTDTNTTYSVKASTQTNGAGIDLDAGGSGSGTDTVKILGSGATTVSRTDASTITISSTDTNTLPNDSTITISAGSGLTNGGSFTTDQGIDGTITLSHADTSSQGSVNNSNGNVIQDITLDGFGHITGLGSVNLDTRYILASTKGAIGGVASLDETGKVPSTQLPSYVDDILEYPNFGEFPATGETAKIYVDLDTNDIYRWGGSSYIQVNNAVSTADNADKLDNQHGTYYLDYNNFTNTPTIPTVNNGQLTLSTSGIADGSATFTSNQSGGSTFTVDVPGTNIAQGTRTSTTVPITSSTGTNATLSVASTTLAGVMSAADKSKLDGIATNANNYTHPSFEDLSLDIDTGVLTGAVIISDLDFNIESTGGHVTAVNATYSTRELTPGDIGAQPAGSYVTTNSVQSLHSTDALRLSGNTISLYKGDGTFESITLTDNTLSTEQVQDIVGGMVTSNTELGIAVTYDDTNGKLNFNVNDPTITLSGDVTGSATMTNLGNVTISTTVANNSHTHTYDNITGMTDGSILFGLDGNLTENHEALYWDNVNRRLGVNTNLPEFTLEVNGDFAATTKSFLIDHPSKEGMKLRHGSLEGPENGVYVRGRLTNNNIIELPDYWIDLVDELSITVQLTSIGEYQELFVKEIKDNKVFVNDVKDCYYLINAERKDVDKMIVEF